jgi:MFS family permease
MGGGATGAGRAPSEEPPMDAPSATSPPAIPPPAGDPRPTRLLSPLELLRLSGYWLGLVAVFAGIGVILQERIKELQPDPTIQYTTLGLIQAAGVVIAVIVQPTIGTISDYTITRFGRRKPYILIGTLLDMVFLVGIATSNTVLAVAAFMILLQFSSNFAQGPFQGYVPDLVPAPQVGIASGLVGLFNILGIMTGTILATVGLVLGDFLWPTILLGVIELVTMLSLFFRLHEGRAARDRGGRGWGSIAREAWGTDILKERSFLFLVASRFFILGGAAFLLNLSVPYMERSQGLTDPGDRALWLNISTILVALSTAAATIPAARLSNRVGRKRVIYGACAMGAVGMTICALAPTLPLFLPGGILTGVAAGSFLAVDWALMTDIIPKAASGRYMGISNVATATNGVAAAFAGGLVIDALVRSGSTDLGPRVAFLLAPVAFAIGALLLRPVDERRREDVPPSPATLETAPA